MKTRQTTSQLDTSINETRDKIFKLSKELEETRVYLKQLQRVKESSCDHTYVILRGDSCGHDRTSYQCSACGKYK